jgi:ABC-type antimicrobial peptide transport system permease subunit
VLRIGLKLVAAGVVAGILASVATNRLIVNELWNTSPYDPLTMVAAVVVIGAVAMSACYVPAARALRVDPMTALRVE